MDRLTELLPLALALAVVAGLAYGCLRVGPRYLVKRVAGLVVVLWGVSFVTFILGYVAPGNPVHTLCGDRCTDEYLRRALHRLGLDLPWQQQYLHYISNLLHGDLGVSFFVGNGRPVEELLARAVPVSATLGLLSLALTLLLGVPLGVTASACAGSRFDTISSAVALVLYAMPVFAVIPFYQRLVVVLVEHGLPSPPLYGWGDPLHTMAPTTLLALGGMGYFMRLTRATMLDVLGQDYILAARARGLRESRVLLRHALRVALPPLVTAAGPAVAFVVSGSFFVESQFSIPGVGWMAVRALEDPDIPLLEAVTLLMALAVVAVNLAVDLLYNILDPRIRLA